MTGSTGRCLTLAAAGRPAKGGRESRAAATAVFRPFPSADPRAAMPVPADPGDNANRVQN